MRACNPRHGDRLLVRKTGRNDWTTPEQIAADIYSPSARGVLGIDLERYARNHGFQSPSIRGEHGRSATRESTKGCR